MNNTHKANLVNQLKAITLNTCNKINCDICDIKWEGGCLATELENQIHQQAHNSESCEQFLIDLNVLPTRDNQKLVEAAVRHVESNNSNEILLECARRLPELENDLIALKREMYRLEQIEHQTQNFKRSLKSFIES